MNSHGNRPLRIAVLGSSVGYYVRPPERHSAPYPIVLEELLRSRGVDAHVLNHSAWFVLVHEAFRGVESMVVPSGAQVIILNFGILEAESTLLPTALVRAVYDAKATSHRIGSALRRHIVRPVHLFHLRVAPRIMRVTGAFHRLSPTRFEFEMTRMVSFLRKERQALVLVLNINPPGDNVEEILPGTRNSVGVYNRILKGVVRSFDDANVRLVDVASMVEREGADRVLPDGIHYSDVGHCIVADMLAREIDCWLPA